MRLGRLALITVLLAALAAPLALAGPGKKVGSGDDEGTPNAFAKGTVFNPKKLFVRIKASPVQPVEVIWDTNCAKEAKGKIRDGEYTITGDNLTSLKKGFKKPDDCLFNVIAAYENAALVGRIEIDLFARVRKGAKKKSQKQPPKKSKKKQQKK